MNRYTIRMRKNIKLLAIFNFFSDLKFHSAILILYFAKITHSYTLAMSLFSVVMISSALFEIPTGIFSDLIGRKKTVILGAVSATISAIFYALGSNYWILFLGAVLEGLARSWYSGNNDALLHDSLKEINRTDRFDEYLGKISAFFQAALMIGAVVGSIIAYWSFSIIMWLSVIPQLTCILIAAFIIERKNIKKESTNIFSHLHLSSINLWRNKRLRLLSIRYMLIEGVGDASFKFRAAFFNTLWPIWAIGFSKAISYFGAGIGFWFSSKIIKKIGIYKVLIISDISNRTISIFSILISNIFSPILMSLTSILYGPGSVATNTLRQQEYSENERATMASLNSLLGNLFFGVFAIILGFLGDKFGPAKALFVSQIFLLPNILIVKKLMRKK